MANWPGLKVAKSLWQIRPTSTQLFSPPWREPHPTHGCLPQADTKSASAHLLGALSKPARVALLPRAGSLIAISSPSAVGIFPTCHVSAARGSLLGVHCADNFKPESVDSTKPGTIETKKGKESRDSKDPVSLTSVIVERASTQTGEGGHVFAGTELPAKEWECVLIYDEELGTFTLEKLDSIVNLNYDRKTTYAPRFPGSPAPAPPPRISATTSSSSSHTQSKPRLEANTQHLDATLNGTEDADGEIDDEFEAAIASAATRDKVTPTRTATTSKAKLKAPIPKVTQTKKKREVRKEEEEEESEGEIVEARPSRPSAPAPPQAKPKPPPPVVKPPPPVVKAPPPVVKPTPARPQPPPPKPRPAAASPAAAAPKLKGKPAAPSPSIPPPPSVPASGKRAYAPDVEEETLEFGRLAQPVSPAKRARLSPPPRAKSQTVGLALPGGGASANPLSLPSSSVAVSMPSSALSLPGSSRAPVAMPLLPAAPAPAPVPAVVDSDEEEWYEVQPAAAPRRIEMEEIVPTSSRPIAIVLEDEDENENENEEEEIDMTAFEAEMNQHLGADMDVDAGTLNDDDDFLAGAMSPVADRHPVSLNQFAGGASEWADDTDYSSSDDSEDE
ncbi:hypothetical protein A0H81_08227 [Grifola frondosa]|uniref:Transcription elongation factor Eaf N-terminal domain-containing protein n=1 Tax=Grifola frondosa TaxID=5627 RepID=A0A1C7M4I0_GRIFR|nr:hypothetical protein A0H81_08227 [Grifola frondosa]